MKIGIVVHSKTGTTLNLAQLAAGKLRDRKHAVDVVALKTDVPPNPRANPAAPGFSILNSPDCKPFDVLLVGGPVWAFSASPVIMAFIHQIRALGGRKALPFVTMGFPFAFMGGTRSIRQMAAALDAAGANVLPGIVIPHMFRDQSRLMEEAADSIPSRLA